MTDQYTPRLNLVLADFNISPWHDKVNNNFRLMDAAIYSILGLAGIKGPFVNSTSVLEGEKYFDTQTSVFYEVVTSYVTSPAPTTFAQERVLFPDNWKVLEVATIAGAVGIVLDAQAAVLASEATVQAKEIAVEADRVTVAADKAIVAADKAIVAADKATVSGWKNDLDAGFVTLNTAIDGKQPLATILTNITTLIKSANKLMYFTGATSIATTDFTPFARQILDDADAAAVRTTLGLGALAQLAEVTATQIAAGTLVTSSEGIDSNSNNTTIPTSKAIANYVSKRGSGLDLWQETIFNGAVIAPENNLLATALASGTLAVPSAPASDVILPWANRGLALRSSASANSGYVISKGSILTYSDGEILFRARVNLNGLAGLSRIGLHNTLDHNAPTRGFFFELSSAGGIVARNGAGASLANAALSPSQNLLLEIIYNDVTDSVRYIADRIENVSRVWTRTNIIDFTTTTPAWVSGNTFAPAIVASLASGGATDLITVFSLGAGIRN